MGLRLFTVAAGCLLATVAAASGADGDETFAYTFTLFLHQLLFVFWLGPDIGVYMWGTKLVNPELSPAQRASAGRIMKTIEIIPMACMSLMLTVGGVLTELKGIDHPAWQMVGIWLLGPFWLTLTLLAQFKASDAADDPLRRLDLAFRWVVIVSVIASVVYSTVTGRLEGLPWLTAKLMLFAAAVFFSLMMRYRIKPLAAAIDTLEQGASTPETDESIRRSLSSARNFMIAGWLTLAGAALLGVFQPGG